ncbi:hypothetical protein JCM10212_005447 [Sporobolomyces blumeae]
MPDPQFSILRIKRKRTAQPLPLDALVIEQPDQPSTKRRKAQHEPTNPSARGIFRFAETVPLDSFDNPIKTRQVKDRIESFLKHPPPHVAARPLARIPSHASLRTSTPSSRNPSPPRTPTDPVVPSPLRSDNSVEPSSSSTTTTTPHQPRRKLPSSAASILLAARASSSLESPTSSSSNPSSQPPSPRTGTHPYAPALAPNALSHAGARQDRIVGGYHAQAKRARYRIIERLRGDTSVPPSNPRTRLSPTSTAPAIAASRDNSTLSLLSEFERSQLARERSEAELVKKGLIPPRIWTRAELEAKQDREERARLEQLELRKRDRDRDEDGLRGGRDRTRIYEAVQEGDEDGADAFERKKRRRREKRAEGKRRVDDVGRDPAMDNFGDMLKEYLTLQERTSGTSTPSSISTPNILPSPSRPDSGSDTESDSSEEEGAEFVYDVYYRDLTLAPPSTTTSNRSGNGDESNPISSVEVGDGAGTEHGNVSSLEGLNRIGALAGFDDSEDDLLQPDQMDDESEEEDNADQDSNEENDYRNDYPDEEEDALSSDYSDYDGANPGRGGARATWEPSDEDDEFDDGGGRDDDDEDHDWR